MSRQNYDATFCGKQPLHQTNQIQPHGILLVVSKSDLQVVQVSENIAEIIDAPGKVLNRSLADILTSAAYQEVKAKSLNLRHAVSIQLSFKHDDARSYLALMHEKDECLIVEVEFSNAMHSGGVTFDAFFSGLQSVMSAINGAKTVEEVASISAREIKRLTGFDKVMIYSFDDAWNGTVIAEDMNDGMDEYLGLKFPASDVPKQARDLYLRNPYRIIPNRAYKPVRLTPEIN